MTHRSPKHVVFQSYNPYERRCSGFKAVSRETLHLIKMLRSQGYTVTVEPNDGTKLNYIAQKGLREILSDPIILFAVGIPMQVLLGVVAAWLYDHLKRPPTQNDANLVMSFDEAGNVVRYNHSGQQISDQRFREILSSLDQRKREYLASLNEVSPDPNCPYPIHLEHTPKIVGWAEDTHFDDMGWVVDHIKIVDNETWQRIQSGELQGLSVGGIITSSICQVCKCEYVDCNHIGGQLYDGKECSVWIASICVAEISIVKEPVQPLARLHIQR
jgi:hypothetical protein